MCRIAARSFDHVIVREDDDLRDREPGELATMMEQELLEQGLPRERVEVVRSEIDAVDHAF